MKLETLSAQKFTASTMQIVFALLEPLTCICDSTKLRNSRLLNTLPVISYEVGKRNHAAKWKSELLNKKSYVPQEPLHARRRPSPTAPRQRLPSAQPEVRAPKNTAGKAAAPSWKLHYSILGNHKLGAPCYRRQVHTTNCHPSIPPAALLVAAGVVEPGPGSY